MEKEKEIIRDHIFRHLARMDNKYRGHIHYSFTKSLWDRLLDTEVLDYTCTAILRGIQISLKYNKHENDQHFFCDLYICVSVLPVFQSDAAMSFFQHNYTLGFLDALINESNWLTGGFSLAHWIFCFDGSNSMINLMFMPPVADVKRALAVMPLDLMTEEEKNMLNI